MSKKFSKDPLRGMEDYYPPDLREENWIIDNIRDVAEVYGYEEFESPQLEPIEIFAAKSSEELVNEQSFIVEKKEGERLILIPELTPSLARMIAKKSQELKKPIRWYSVPTCFRYERPQRGRRRQFKQINFDILGEDRLYGDLEIFNIIVDIFTRFGATAEQFQIYYNNRRFIDAVCDLLLKIPKEKLPDIYKALDKAEKMEEKEFVALLSNLFQDNTIIQGILKLKKSNSIEDLLKNFDEIPESFYASEGYKELKEFKTLLEEANLIDYCTFSSGIVRGLDYYTGIVYEVYDTGTENTRSIFGGGRYDDLLSLFSDEQISGTGFGLGLVMLSLFLETYNLIPQEVREIDYSKVIYIAGIKESVRAYVLQLAQKIRGEDFPCIVDYRFSNLKNQLSRANDLGNLITLIIGPNEVKESKVTIKNMISEEQITVVKERVIEEIYKIINEYEN
ncbi:MAG: histidine--tRNA ligase [Promethearchaeota archaeon]|nr:MAG: histidine--tRNA ligase [Candidatus Lokiarchaeota archaeon]